MTRDYAKPSTSRRNNKPAAPKKKLPIWAFLLGLAVLGCFGGFLYYLTTLPETETTIELPEDLRPTKQDEKSIIAEPTPPRFQFYDMFKESEVVKPPVEAYQFKEKAKAGVDFLYMVQTGSFRNRTDAERQKATIGFQGMQANITEVETSGGATWHRVQVGPFSSRSKMNAAVDKLVAINIQPLVKKIDPPSKQ